MIILNQILIKSNILLYLGNNEPCKDLVSVYVELTEKF